MNKGDRVQVTYEAIYAGVYNSGDYRLTAITHDDTFAAPADAVITVLQPAVPKEPAFGSVVIDSEGDSWQNRADDDGWCCSNTFTGGLLWRQLVEVFGPVKIVHTP